MRKLEIARAAPVATMGQINEQKRKAVREYRKVGIMMCGKQVKQAEIEALEARIQGRMAHLRQMADMRRLTTIRKVLGAEYLKLGQPEKLPSEKSESP